MVSKCCILDNVPNGFLMVILNIAKKPEQMFKPFQKNVKNWVSIIVSNKGEKHNENDINIRG